MTGAPRATIIPDRHGREFTEPSPYMGLVQRFFVVLALLVACASGQSTSPPAYTNHTVGGSAGWFFNSTTETPSADYSAWARPLTFNLGDYLIFNTNSNHTVVQTYNKTSYQNCDVGDDESNEDVSVYTAGEGFGKPAVIAVPLTKAVSNYFFSDADDGNECEHGMKFEIKVNVGHGLPPNLNHPPPPPYKDPSEAPPDPTSESGVVVGNGKSPSTNGSARGRFPSLAVIGFHLCLSLLLALRSNFL